jgi:hypothetical protein
MQIVTRIIKFLQSCPIMMLKWENKIVPYCIFFLLIVCYFLPNIGKADSPNLRSFTQQFPGTSVDQKKGNIVLVLFSICYEL